MSLEHARVVVTKDADFVQSFLLHGRPYKLLLVNTGNISNDELLALFEARCAHLVGWALMPPGNAKRDLRGRDHAPMGA